MEVPMSLDAVGGLLLLLGAGLVIFSFFLPKLKKTMEAKDEKEELDTAMKQIYALAEGDDYLVRRALRETVDPNTGKSTVEDVKVWLEKRKETNSD